MKGALQIVKVPYNNPSQHGKVIQKKKGLTIIHRP